jgi:fido (protein-threonine AMPylation protein)
MSPGQPSIGFLYATAFIVVVLFASNSYAFTPVLPLRPPRRKDTTLKRGDDNTENSKIEDETSSDGYYYLQDKITKAREMESSATDCDFSEATSAFDRPLTFQDSLYGDDVAGMVKHLPALFDQCKQLENTALGLEYANLRLAIFVLGSNKLEGTMTPNASEGDTFQVLLKYLKFGGNVVHLIPLKGKDDNERISWDEEGQNVTIEAWYQQCMCHMKALVMMLDWAKAGEPLTTEKLLACHSQLMSGSVTSTGAAFESRFRDEDEPVYAASYSFPFRINHEKSMADILEKINSDFGTCHPAEWSSKLLLGVLSAHPFLNGNGRMARLCFAYGLVRHGVPSAVVFSDWHSKARGHYIDAVKVAQGQKGEVNLRRLHTMATVGLFATLQNMVITCDTSK